MPERQKWTAHEFNLGIDPDWSSNVLTRVTDTAIRLEHHCRGLSDEELSYGPTGKWSIKEHVGHLYDLEDLFTRRFIDFSEYKEELIEADMSNAKTEESNHQQDSLATILSKFKKGRAHLIKTYKGLAEEVHQHIALHPRLKVPMRPVDLLFFVAEHDDHHIRSMLDIRERLGK